MTAIMYNQLNENAIQRALEQTKYTPTFKVEYSESSGDYSNSYNSYSYFDSSVSDCDPDYNDCKRHSIYSMRTMRKTPYEYRVENNLPYAAEIASQICNRLSVLWDFFPNFDLLKIRFGSNAFVQNFRLGNSAAYTKLF